MASGVSNSPNKWLVLTLVYIILFVQFGLLFTIGATFVALLDKYQLGRSRTSIVQSLFLGLGLGLGAVAGVLVDKFGLLRMSVISSVLCPLGFIVSYFSTSIEFLYISIGVVSGIGVCLSNVCSSTTLVGIFTGKQRALALSIAYSAPGLASLVHSYFIDWSLNTYGVNGTWLLIGGLYLNSWPLPLLIGLNKQSFETKLQNKTTNSETKSTGVISTTHQGKEEGFVCCRKDGDICKLLSIFRNKPYIFMLLGSNFVIGSTTCYMGLVFDISAWKMFSTSQTLLLFVPYAACNTLFRILNGVIQQRRGINSYIYPCVTIICGIVAYFINYYADKYWAFMVGMSLVGISNGGTVSAAITLAVKLVDKEHQTVASGIIFTIIGIFSIALTPLFGALRDITGSYELVSFVTIAFSTSGVIFFGVVCRKKAATKQNNKDMQTNVIYVTHL